MLLARPAAWGVDLTGGAVRAVRIERRGTRFRIIDAVVQPIAPAGEGAEALRAHLPETVGRGLTDLIQSRQSTLSDPVFVAFPAFGSKHGRIEVPGSDPAQMQKLLDFELHQALKGSLEPWLVRMTPPHRTGSGGVAAGFHAHRRELIESFVADVRRFGLPIDALVPGPLALARYADLEWPTRGRRLVLEVQRTRTDFVYSSEHGPRWRSLPFGCGSLPEDESRANVASADVDRLALQIHREHLLAHRALFGAHDGTALERIVLLGDGGGHDALRRTLTQHFGVEVVVPHTAKHFDVSDRATGGSAHRVLSFGTALGLAVAALSRRGEVNTLVEPPPARRALRRLPALSAALFVIALGLLATRLIADREVARLETMLVALRDGVRWTSTGDFESARDAALASAAEARRLLGDATALRREVGFPSRLLQALSDPAVFFRLVSLELLPISGDRELERRDEAKLVFEVENGLAGAADLIREQLQKRAGVTVLQVETRSGENGALLVELKVAVHAPEHDS